MTAKSPEALARRRERERQHTEKRRAEVQARLSQMPPVECACGCGTLIPPLTLDGRTRRYADRHGGRAPRRDTDTNWDSFTGPRFDVEPSCAREEPELFWSFDDAETAKAKAICHRCPVREQCLAWALENHEHDGVWGGMTSLERLRLRRRNLGPDLATLARSAVEEAMVRGLTHEQKRAAVVWLTQRGESAEQIAGRLGMSSRSVHRWRRRLREAA